MKQFLIIALLLCSIAVSAQTKPDTAKVKQPDSVSIRLSLKEFQDYMQTLGKAIELGKTAKKPSEAATSIVFMMQVYEGLEEKAKPIYKPKTK